MAERREGRRDEAIRRALERGTVHAGSKDPFAAIKRALDLPNDNTKGKGHVEQGTRNPSPTPDSTSGTQPTSEAGNPLVTAGSRSSKVGFTPGLR